MPRFILVPASGADGDAPVFAAALAVARAWTGHIKFLHVRADLDAIVMSAAASGMFAGGGFADVTARLERDITDQQQRAERKVRDFCAHEEVPLDSVPGANRVSAEWQVEIGDERTLLAAHGRMADVVVVGRVRDGEPVAMDLLEAALIATGRPILIAATAKPLQVEAGTVAIAWKDTREAARALAAASPFIAKAARVVILSVEEGTNGREHSGNRLCQALKWHNPEVTLQRLVADGRAPVETLLDALASLGANLLVMGGYSHSRMREVIFGGFTRRVLQNAELPVLMAR